MDRHQVIVVGGGPAGLMAAGQACASVADTLLLEKMEHPGRKLRITGKGRCNLTNVAPIGDFIQHFNPNGRFLYSAFSHFFSDDLITFLSELGVATVTERGGRVFPVSNDAQHIVDALTRWAEKQGVVIQVQTKVEQLLIEQGRIVGVEVLHNPKIREGKQSKDRSLSQRYFAERVILTTGGASYPGTGSTGDGYRLAKAVGHTIIPIRPALVPLETHGDTALRLKGLSLRNANVTLIVDGEKRAEAFGEMLFTHFGLSGPVILTLSRRVVDALRDHQEVTLSIDLKPALDDAKLDARLLHDIDLHGKQHYQTLLQGLLPKKLIPVCIDLTGIPPDKQAHQITSQERSRLRIWLKDFRFQVTGHRPFTQAIITAGGIDTREVDPRTMASRIIDGLYFAGEVLDIDADTGGYNLQAAFSTGWLAGRSTVE
ncbi:MAG: FAD-dependent oxidoreductase [Chloroflexi bacterium RBG_16_48_8]|nr:MAG: FAD-dependent oxidoreductase [Chloroflexi bacterium RBG_16_48_8]